MHGHKTSHLPIRYFLALLWAHPILHISTIRVKHLHLQMWMHVRTHLQIRFTHLCNKEIYFISKSRYIISIAFSTIMAFISELYFIFSNTTQDFVYNVLQSKYQPCCLKVKCKQIQHYQLLWHYNQNWPNGSWKWILLIMEVQLSHITKKMAGC